MYLLLKDIGHCKPSVHIYRVQFLQIQQCRYVCVWKAEWPLPLAASCFGVKAGLQVTHVLESHMETQITPAFTIQDVSELCISQMCIYLDCGIKLQRLKWNHSETRTLRKIHRRGFTPPGDRTCKNLQKLSQQLNTVPAYTFNMHT